MQRGSPYPFVICVAALASATAMAQEFEPGGDLRGTLNDDGRAASLDLSGESSPLIAVLVDGATVYDTQELAAVYANRLGRAADMAALVALAEDITARYREDGYFLSRAAIPEAALNEGIAHVVVYEGYIADIRFVGEVPPRARTLMADLLGERPINLRSLDRKLALLRDTPGLLVRRAELEPDLDDPRAHNLVLELEQRRMGGEVSADNRGSDDYGGWRFIVDTEAYGWLRPGDRTGLRIVTAPSEPDRFRAYELSYLAPVGSSGARVEVELGEGRLLEDDGEVRDLQSASARYERPLRAGREAEGAFFVELAALDVTERDHGIYDTDEELLTLAAGFSGRFRHRFGATSYYSQALFGRAASPVDSLRSRLDADDTYARLNFSMQHRTVVGEDIELTLRLAAQIGDGPMPRSQEISIGGRLYGRGYLHGALRGDSGLAASIEGRYTGLPHTELFGRPEPYVFLDGGVAFNGYLGGARANELASSGAGVRVHILDRFSLELEIARALLDADDGAAWRQNVNLSLDF